MLQSYTLEDYSSISFANNYQFVLSPESLAIITKLYGELNVSETITKSVDSSESNKSISRRPKSNKSAIDTTWEKCKVFKTTTIEKKDGVEKNMNDIRICLNKLSESNYEITRTDIFNILKELTEEPLLKVAELIFDIASTNQYFSELYAVLYKELTVEFPIFKTILPDMLQTRYIEQLSQILFVDMETNFDLYCDNQKLNDKRKALSAFLVNLLKTDLCDTMNILTILSGIIERINTVIDVPDKLYEVEELTENIFIIITRITENAGHELKEKEQENIEFEKKEKKKSKNKNEEAAKMKPREMSGAIKNVLLESKYNRSNLFETNEWKAIVDKLQVCSRYVAKEHVSISSRVVFRYKDIMDNIKKNGGM
jgi:hypothetical protein